TGGLGSDTLSGGEGNDVLQGVQDSADDGVIDSSDVLDADTLQGGEGDDVLLMGSGDMAEGGAGADVFQSGIWVDEDNLPQVSDFDVAEDTFVVLVAEGNGAGTVTVDADAAQGAGWFTVSYDGTPVASVYGPGMDASNVSVVESEVVAPAPVPTL
ncbi:MAG: hypothetical protein GY767_03615, partial [Shimia sp.]|nr:hypothetical protein [Shimia sp.]